MFGEVLVEEVEFFDGSVEFGEVVGFEGVEDVVLGESDALEDELGVLFVEGWVGVDGELD